MDAEHGKKWVRIIIYIGLAAGTIAAYEPMRHNGFVNYDDDIYLVENPDINSGITWQSLKRVITGRADRAEKIMNVIR